MDQVVKRYSQESLTRIYEEEPIQRDRALQSGTYYTLGRQEWSATDLNNHNHAGQMHGNYQDSYHAQRRDSSPLRSGNQANLSATQADFNAKMLKSGQMEALMSRADYWALSGIVAVEITIAINNRLCDYDK